MNIYKVIIFVSFTFGFYANAQTKNTIPTKTLIEKNFRLQYPAHWILDKSNKYAHYAFFSKKTSIDENVTIDVQDYTNSLNNFKNHVEISVRQLPIYNNNLVILQNTTVNEKGKTYQKIIYTSKHQGIDVKFEMYIFFVNQYAYTLTYTALKKNYLKYLSAAEIILNSFTVTNTTPPKH